MTEDTNAAVGTSPVKKEDKLFHIFYNTIKSCKMGVGGDVIVFSDHKCITDNAKHITHLNKEIKLGHPHLYVKKGEETKLASELDPEEAKKKKIIAEYLEEQKKLAAVAPAPEVKKEDEPKPSIAEILAKAKDKQQVLKPASSVDLSSISSESNN